MNQKEIQDLIFGVKLREDRKEVGWTHPTTGCSPHFTRKRTVISHEDMNMRRAPLIAFHNKGEIDFCQECGCYHCLKVYPKEEIKNWTDDSKTALCPHCGVDAVLPETAYSLTEEVLKSINDFWFNQDQNPPSHDLPS